MQHDDTDYGVMRRRIIALEHEQSLLGRRVDALERRLRAENIEPIPGDITWHDDAYVGILRMLPPEQEDDHK